MIAARRLVADLEKHAAEIGPALYTSPRDTSAAGLAEWSARIEAHRRLTAGLMELSNVLGIVGTLVTGRAGP